MNKLTSLPANDDMVKQLPIMVLMLKSDCNCRCTMCDIWKGNSSESLEYDGVKDLVKQLQSLDTHEIVLSGGEPLMHREIESVCRLLSTMNFRVTLITTGLLLKRHAQWISKYIDQIYISLDGPEKVHNSIRNIPGAYVKIKKGVEAVRHYRPDINIGARCTIQKQNYRYIGDTVDAARELGMNTISFLAADVKAEVFGRTSDWKDNGIALTGTELSELEDILQQFFINYKNDFDSGFIVEDRNKLQTKLLDYYHALSTDRNFPGVDCNAPWVSAVVETNGKVRPCFFHKPYDEALDNKSVNEIINSDTAKKWRKELDVKTNDICRSCVCSLSYGV